MNNNNPFNILSGAVEEKIKVEEKGRKPQMRVPIAARFDRRGSFRGEFPMLVRAEEVTHTSPAAAELASRLATNHRLLHSLDASEEIIQPAGLSVPKTKGPSRFDMDVTVETVLARQAELVGQALDIPLTATTTVFQPVAEFIPLETRPQRIYQQDGRWYADDVDMLKRSLHRVMDWRQMPAQLADGFTKGAIRHPDVNIVSGGHSGEAFIHVIAAKCQIPLTPQDKDLDWSTHLHVQHMLTSMSGIDPAPMAGYRVMSPTLRFPTGVHGGKVQYGPWEQGEEYRDLESAGWFELANCPASWCRKIAESFMDVPGIFGTSSEWTRRFFDVILLQAGRDYRRGGAYVELSHGEFFKALHDLRADLIGHIEVSRGFVEGFDNFGKEISNAMRTRLRAHWLRQFTLERVGLDRLSRQAEANLAEQMADPEDAAAFWRVYPALALHGAAALPAYTTEQNLWLDLACGRWPSLWQAPQVSTWAFAEDEYLILAGEKEAPVSFGVSEEVSVPISIGFSWDFDVDGVYAPAEVETVELLEEGEAPRAREVPPKPEVLDLVPKDKVKQKRKRDDVYLEVDDTVLVARPKPMSQGAMEVMTALAHFGPGFHCNQPESYASVKRLQAVVVNRMEKLSQGESATKHKILQALDAGMPHLETALFLLQPRMNPIKTSAAVREAEVVKSDNPVTEMSAPVEEAVVEATAPVAETVEAEVEVGETEVEADDVTEEEVSETAPETEAVEEAEVVKSDNPVTEMSAPVDEVGVAVTADTPEAEVPTAAPEAIIDETIAEEEAAVTEVTPEPETIVEETVVEETVEAPAETPALPESVMVQEDTHEALIAGAEPAPARVLSPAAQQHIMMSAMGLVSTLGVTPEVALALAGSGLPTIDAIVAHTWEEVLCVGVPLSAEVLREVYDLAMLTTA